MKSNVIAFGRENTNINAILEEAERVAVYNGLQGKDVLHLRLLTEEVCCMIDSLVQFFEGSFYLENKGNSYKLSLVLNADEMSKELKEELIKASSSGKNASAKGLIGRIRNVVQDYAMWHEDNTVNMYRYVRDEERSDYTSAWYLSDLKEESQKSDSPAMWDDLGKSILVKLASEVIVGVNGTKIEIVVKKEFGR